MWMYSAGQGTMAPGMPQPSMAPGMTQPGIAPAGQMQRFGVENAPPDIPPGQSRHSASNSSRVVAVIVASAVLALLLTIVFLVTRPSSPTRPPLPNSASRSTLTTTITSAITPSIYHGYETMPFYFGDLQVSHFAPDCNALDGRINPKAPPENGFVGPFSFENVARTLALEMHACSDNGTVLGEFSMHQDPCDKIGTPARIGIQNTGNSCFLNSAMQVLLGIPGICAAIFDERYVLDSVRSPIPALRDFADSYRNAHGAVAREDARRFRQALLNLKVVHSISGQEDSSEALAKLFSLYSFPPHSPYISLRSSYLAFDRKDLVADTSGKDDYYDASCSAENPDKCRTDGTVEPTPLVQLPLPFMSQPSITLDEVYAESFQRELMNSPVRVRIPPDPLKAAAKYEKVSELTVMAPQLLLNVLLEAYDLHHNRVRKRDDKIQVPAVWRNMTLVGISQHLGSDNAGHYVAYKKRCEGSSIMMIAFKEWVKYNDDLVSLEATGVALAAAAEGKLLYFARDPQLPPCESLALS